MARDVTGGRSAVLVSLTTAAAVLTTLIPACEQVEVARLYAVHSAPSLPLELRAGGGHVSGKDRRLEELMVDTDPVHKASASCHHGPPITDPVSVEIEASYTERNLTVAVRWEDATHDPHPRSWRRSGEAWTLGDGDEDGVAILWSRGGGEFGCQGACHMRDFTVRGGSLVDMRAMYIPEGEPPEEAWVWKSSTGAGRLLLGGRGFVDAASGRPYRTLNSAVAADGTLRPEARRAGTFGEGDRPLWDAAGGPLPEAASNAPAYLYEAAEDGAPLTATAERWRRGWKVTFVRPLDGGQGGQSFRPGGSYRFGVALFDGTSTDHHLVRDTQFLEILPPSGPGDSPGGGSRAGRGIL